MVDHEVDEFTGFRTDLMVHLLGGLDHKFGVTSRFGVAVRKHHFFVIAHDVIKAKPLGLRIIEFLA